MKGFISYSHDDIDECQLFMTSLRESSHLVEKAIDPIWVDKKIKIGESIGEKVQHAILTSNIAFCLVSKSFFESDFIRDVELPAIKAKVSENKMVIFPIKVGEFSFQDYKTQFRDLLAWPLKEGRLISINELSSEEVSAFFSDLHRHATAACQLWEKNFALSPIHNVTDRALKDMSGVLSGLYKRFPEKVAFALAFEFWDLWSNKGNRDAATKLAIEFKASLKKRRVSLDSGHKSILSLFENGLPESPAHLDILRVSHPSELINAEYAKLLLGIRLTELNYKNAERFFQDLVQMQPIFRNCALIEYVQGQCLRKHGENLVEAIDRLELAHKHCTAWPNETCKCTGACPKGVLQLEICRGLGAAYRRLGNPERAKHYFSEGELLLQRPDVPAHIKADLLYSFGYFLFEDSIQSSIKSKLWQLSPEQDAKLREAKLAFEKCIACDSEHNAAHTRLEIVKKLLGEFELKGWFRSLTYCEKHKKGEAILSTYLCGFAIKLYSLTTDSQHNATISSEDLYKKLVSAFQTWAGGVPLGPIKCHLFDLKAIKWSANIENDYWLDLTFKFLESSCDWVESQEVSLKEAQLKGINRFELKHKVKRR